MRYDSRMERSYFATNSDPCCSASASLPIPERSHLSENTSGCNATRLESTQFHLMNYHDPVYLLGCCNDTVLYGIGVVPR